MSAGQFVSNCTADALAQAASNLKAGFLVAFPTETVYGLGADANNAEAVARIYQVKGRPTDHPLIVHIASMQGISEWAEDIPDYAIALARKFWPGPMTLIFQRSEIAKDFITGGQESIALRVPDHTVALALINEFSKVGGKGIAAPSANRFGHVSPTTSVAVQEELSEFLSKGDLILDGGPSRVGVESTIIDCTQRAPRILRPGAITIEMIEETTGAKVVNSGGEIRVSGSLEKHYSPMAKVSLNEEAKPGEGLIALHEVPTPEGVIRLASPKSADEFARTMYAALRDADTRGLQKVVAITPQGDGIEIAICDRLERASKGR
jgi:L-threonylcarbamoyladenylate synthase